MNCNCNTTEDILLYILPHEVVTFKKLKYLMIIKIKFIRLVNKIKLDLSQILPYTALTPKRPWTYNEQDLSVTTSCSTMRTFNSEKHILLLILHFGIHSSKSLLSNVQAEFYARKLQTKFHYDRSI